MDINLLVLNVGNSRVAVGCLGGELEYSVRLSNTARADWGGKIGEAWKRVSGRRMRGWRGRV